MKICFFVLSLEKGGTEIYLLRFLRYFLKNNKAEVTVFCKGNLGGSLLTEFEELGINIVLAKVSYFNIFGITSIARHVKGKDAVCDLTGNFSGMPMLISWIFKVQKRISFYRASTNHFKPSPLKNTYNRFFNYLVYRFSTDILSNSKAAFNFFFNSKHTNDNRFKVVPNGFGERELINETNETNENTSQELRTRYGIPLDKIIIGHVGRYNQAKNFPFIFQVIKEFSRQEYKNIHFVFCGRGTDSAAFKGELEQLGIDSFCSFLGSQNKILEIYQCYDLFFFPSITEGQPNALIEAMVMGIPFIAADIPPIRECIPKEAMSQLITLNSSKNALNELVAILNESNKEKYIHKKWAIDYFKPKKRFEQFAKVIRGY
tara:strand:+ start:4342 stop:5463 length:1122 start_codon:yes stop_codon:yes gene_type:complete